MYLLNQFWKYFFVKEKYNNYDQFKAVVNF